MRKSLIPILLLLVFIFVPLGTRAETLHDYYINTYGKVPSWENRTLLTNQCGIKNYLANRSQNISLLACLKKQTIFLGGSNQDIVLGGLVTKPYTFVPNTIIKSAEVNADFDTLYNLVNGQITNPNISASAAIDRTKINGTAIVSTGVTSQTINSTTTTINGTLLVNTTSGYLRAPIMTIAQRDAQGAVEAGAIIYASDAGQFYVREGGTWSPISPAAATALANTTTKGIVEEADITELSTNTGTGGTGARLYINPVLTASSSLGVADAHKVMRLRSDGKADASLGGGASSLATLNAISTVVQNPASATSTPTSGSIPISDSDGKIYGWSDGTQIFTYTAGENIDASVTPQALFANESDGRVYKLNATTASSTLYNFIGFAPLGQNITTGNTIRVQINGIVKGFTALTLGAPYYGTNTAGTISTTAGTKVYKIGRAKSTTELLIEPGKKIASGTETFSTTASSVITIGFRPSRVRVEGFQDTDHTSSGGWTVNGGNLSALSNGSAGGAGNTNKAWSLGAGGTINQGTIINIISSGFTLSNVKTGAPGDAALYWEAEE